MGTVAICVPARDERALLPNLLAALARQERHGGGRTILCLLFDGCRDGSDRYVEEARHRLPFELVTDMIPAGAEPNAGRARRAALAIGERVLAGRRGGALLTTDADCVPAPDWIAASCRALAMADVVAGRIVREPAPGQAAGQGQGAQDRVEEYYERLYALRRRIDPVAWEAPFAHHYTAGASMAFRAEAYAALGGFAPLPSGEDATIVDEAQRLGLRVRRDRAVVVETSARRDGRAPAGLAAQLTRLDAAEGRGPLVSHPAEAVWQYEGHAAARAAFPRIADPAIAQRLAERLETGADHIARVAAMAVNAEAFATHVVPACPGAGRPVTLAEAERALVQLEAERRVYAA